MDNRKIFLSTNGIASRYLTDERIDEIVSNTFSYATKEAYSDCLRSMLDKISDYYEEGIPTEQYNEKSEITLIEGVIILVVALLSGVGVYIFVSKGYQMNGKEEEYLYMKYGNLHLIHSEDRFLRQNITQQRIKRDEKDSESSTHTSSSGRTHGGGGHSF